MNPLYSMLMRFEPKRSGERCPEINLFSPLRLNTIYVTCLPDLIDTSWLPFFPKRVINHNLCKKKKEKIERKKKKRKKVPLFCFLCRDLSSLTVTLNGIQCGQREVHMVMVALSGPSSSTCLGGFSSAEPGNGPIHKASGEHGHFIQSRVRAYTCDAHADKPILRTESKYKVTCTPDTWSVVDLTRVKSLFGNFFIFECVTSLWWFSPS